MQIAESQCHFLELITKISNAKKILEIGTFTGLSTLSMALGLPDNGSLIALDKNSETNLKAQSFFKKANQDKKIKTIVNPALKTLEKLKHDNLIFDIIFIDGMHQVEYVLKDFNNSVKFLNKNGIIFLDDVLPISKNEQEKIPINPIYENSILKYSSPWTGDVWKFMYYLLLNFKDKICGK